MTTHTLVKTDDERTRIQSPATDLASIFPVFDCDPYSNTVFDLFSTVVRQFPDAVAISGKLAQPTADDLPSVTLTYAELWNYAAAFRYRLLALGVGPGDFVGIAASRSVATIAAILGVVMAGGCYVPIDFKDYPPEVVRQMIPAHTIRCWILDAETRKTGAPFLPESSETLALEEMGCPVHPVAVDLPAPPITAESPLYVMFTSGSTGQPKGVVVPHRAVVRLVSGQQFMEFGPHQAFLLHSPLSFDASTLELWGALLHGSQLVVAPARRMGLDDYANLISEENITALWMTAALFHLAAAHQPEMFAPLQQLLFGGDVIAPRAVEKVRGMFPSLRMVNGYGPTENTTFTCCYVVPENYRADGPLPIGRPLAHTTVEVLDDAGQPVLAGESGELVAGGAGVALGYLSQPAMTAERFPPDFGSSQPGALRYRTGDRVRLLADGKYEFLGRLDGQIKIAGQRVEVNIVEHAIAALPQVADAAVVVLHSPSGEKKLAACVALVEPAVDAEARLREALQGKVARAAVPQHWLVLGRLPVTSNGKTDRNALRTLCETRFPVAEPGATAALATAQAGNSLETVLSDLRQVWSLLLGRQEVGSDDNFFDLGGTSLLLIEMHSQLRQRYSSMPSLVEMFDCSTPRLLATRLQNGAKLPARNGQAENAGQRQRAAMLGRSNSRIAAKPVAVEVLATDKDGVR